MKAGAYISVAVGLLLTATSGAMAQPLSVEDYCDVKRSRPASIKEMRPMADGKTYAAITDDGRAIQTFSYATGKQTGTLFHIDSIKGDCRIKNFDGYEVSANGKKLLLWNDKTKIYRHSFTAHYYVYDIMRRTLKPVSADGAQRGAVISHDGRMVAYGRDNNVYISNLDYGTDRPITEDGERNKIIYGVADWGYEEEFGVVNTLVWSADDAILAFMRFDESKVPTYTFDIYSDYCQPQPEYDYYPGQFTYKYPLAGCNNSVVSVLAYDLDNRTTKTMDLGLGEKDYVPSLAFGADGVTLMAMVLNRDQNQLRLFKVNPRSTTATLIYTDRSDAWLSPGAYQMVDYRKDAFVIGSERTGYRHLYEYDYNGNLRRTITSGDWNVTAYYGYRPKTGEYFFQCTKLGAPCRNVARSNAKNVVTLLNDRPGTESAAFCPSMEYYVRTYSNAVTPPQYTLMTTAGTKIADLELNAAYAARFASAPKKELLTVPNADGQPMNAYVIKPADFDVNKKYPLLMYQYNGPDSQEVLDAWKMEGLYYLASEGYVVACVDGRGTGNRSRQWANIVYKNLGHYETLDQLAGARWFMSQPWIDAERTACFGWSYGGYMTLMELGAEKSPFRAGVAMAPVTDWRFYDAIYTERFMLTPQQNAAGYESASALNRTGGMNARLLIMSGTADDNVHFYNTLKYTSKLTAEGKLFSMMAYTGFEHSLRMCNARVMLYSKILDYLRTELR